MKLKILIADDHPLLLHGIEKYLISNGFIVINTASDGLDAYNKILEHNPDIAILDFDMPKQNGLEVAQLTRKHQPDVKIIILSLHKRAELANQVGEVIDAYLTKDTALEEIVECIQEIQKGNQYISPSIDYQSSGIFRQNSNHKITKTETKILKYIAEGKTSNQIAENLFISVRTVEKHRSNIIKKLNLDSKPNALLVWIQNNPHVLEA